MSYRELKTQVKQCVEAALAANGFPTIEFEPVEPPRPEFGDLSVSVALNLAGRLKMKPLDVAERIVSKIVIPEGSLIRKCWVHPPGYVNFNSIYPQYAKQTILNTLRDGASYGRVNIGGGARVGIEHTSVNPNKALHYGHLRNVVLGDSVRRLLSFAGYEAQTLNYIDDSGLQVADLIVGFRYAGFNTEPEGAEKFDHYCGDTVYVKVNELYETRKDLAAAQKQVLREMEDHTSDTARLASKITLRILGEQLKTCWRIGARYDLLNFESHILQTRMWNDVFEQLKSRGLVEYAKEGKYAGCWIVRVEGEYEGEEKVIVRSDGTATYIAKDIPYAAWKLGLIPDRFGYRVFNEQPDEKRLWSTVVGKGEPSHPVFAPYSKAITVIDVRQGRLQRIIGRILSNLSGDVQVNRYVHLYYEIVSLSGKTVEELGLGANDKRTISMSGRRGIYINADDVLDAVHRKAYEETKKRNPDEDDAWLHKTAEKIAVAAIRYELLKQDLGKTIVFDLERALDLEGETGPYLQYAYARATRIIEKAGNTSTVDSVDLSKLTDTSEVALIKEISKFDLIIEESVKNLAPKVIAHYLYNTVSLFNTFYEKMPVLKERDESVKGARLTLVKAFQTVVKNGLSLLGIESPDRI
ncbi:MAG: arginine--tRNA ligase [Thaumarchaeota archaeon]|nr:arginine--tRNA ligase [Nitrososphaerota archaeon]MCL5317428.1 arginine--tRNA ligase [Nitrososphaerota archaeon]